jgi:hypothetical protein
LEGKGIPLLARRLREVLNGTASVSARAGVNEHDGDQPSPSAEEPAVAQEAPAESAAKEAGGRRRRPPLPARRRAGTAAAAEK